MLYIWKSFYANLFKKKSLSVCCSLETKLSRCLSVYQLFFYSVSVMAGAGIYILAGHMIKNRAGPSTNLSFLIGGFSSFFTGLCYCELSTLMPQAGSCYTYTYVLIGELPAFIIGWTVIMDFIITLSSVSKGFSAVINMISNDRIDNFTRRFLPLANNSEVWDKSVDLIAALLILCLFVITITGANISFNVNTALQTIQILCLSIVTIAFFAYGNSSNYIADGGYMPFGFTGVIQGAGIAIFAYSGFECIANCAEELKNPKKSIPIALFSSLSFVIFLYFAVTTGLSYMVPRLQINEKSPFVGAFEYKGLEGFKWIAIVGTLISTGATKLSVTYLIARIIYAVAKDGLMFKFLGDVNETTKVPIKALFAGCLIALILAMFVKIESLADVTSMGILISFIAVGIDLIVYRYITKSEAVESNETDILNMRTSTHEILCKRRSFIINLVALIISFFIFDISVIFAIKYNFILGVVCSIISISFVICFFVILCLYEPSYDREVFQTPFMPVAPVVTIMCNMSLLLSLPGATWIRFLIWIVIGIIVYVSYGLWRFSRFGTEEEYNELSENLSRSYSNSGFISDLPLEDDDKKK